ncbi:MAG: multiprotein bridging factor aMBF1 [Pyrobaculum sp.]
MFCEICGKPIEGEPIPVEVDKAVLYVCRSCAARYGKKQPPMPQRRQQPQPRPRPPPTRAVYDLEIVENFGELIKKSRENLGLSREALAAMIGVKETVLRRIESGQLQPDVSLARKLEKILGIKLFTERLEDGGTRGGAVLDRSLTLGEVAEVRDESEK